MNLLLDSTVATGYVSASQKARVMTEHWIAANLFCPVCGVPVLSRYAANQPVADFFCDQCREEFELKAKRTNRPQMEPHKIVNGSYEAVIRRITSLHNPHLLCMTHHQSMVTNLLFIPKFFFVPEIIEKRKPLASSARRAGWVGCTINLAAIPATGKVAIVHEGIIQEPSNVIAWYQKIKSFRSDNLESRAWLLDVLCCIEQLGNEFSLRDVYRFTDYLAGRHPKNHNIQPKIRQQLQILRNKGFLEFMAKGVYKKL